MKKVEVNIGPQINCADAVESVEINDSTKLICNCSKVIPIIKLNQDTTCFFCCCKFRSTSHCVLPLALVLVLSWTFSSASTLVAVGAMLLLEDF